MPTEISSEEIEKMRQIIKEHDSERKPMQVIDLNNPPKEPYRFQKFPMMVYDLKHSKPERIIHMVVKGEEDLQKALENGWEEKAPAFSEKRIEPLSPAYQAEAARLDAALHPERRKPGRKPKLQEQTA